MSFLSRFTSKFALFVFVLFALVPQTLAFDVDPIADQYAVVGTEVDVNFLVSALPANTGRVDAYLYWGDGSAENYDDCAYDMMTSTADCSFSYTYGVTGFYNLDVMIAAYDVVTDEVIENREYDGANVTVVDSPSLSVTTDGDQTIVEDDTFYVHATVDSKTNTTEYVMACWQGETAPSEATCDTITSSYNPELGEVRAEDVLFSHIYADPGMYTVTIWAKDAFSLVSTTLSLIVEGRGPDLTVSSIAIVSGHLQFSVSNVGNTAVDSSLNVATTYAVDGESIGSYYSSVSGNEYFIVDGVKTFFTATSFAPGTHTVTVCADSENAVAESDRSNNCLTQEFVTTPDLTVSSIYLESSSYGSTYMIWFDFANIGSADVILDEYRLIDTSLSIDGEDIVGGADWLEGIGAGETVAYYTGLLLEEGAHTVEICVDTGRIISESDEYNNCLTASLGEEVPASSVFSVTAGLDQIVTLGDAVTVQALASLDPMEEGFILDDATITWGDGTSSDYFNGFDYGDLSHNFVHTYGASGVYEALVTMNAGGYTDTDTVLITVNADAGGGDQGGDQGDDGSTDGTLPFSVGPVADQYVVAGWELAITVPVSQLGVNVGAVEMYMSWGDGAEDVASPCYLDSSTSTAECEFSHIYPVSGRYDLDAIVNTYDVETGEMLATLEYDGAEHDGFAVTVFDPVAITVLTSTTPAVVGVATSLDIDVTGGIGDLTTLRIEWGDGTIDTIDPVAGETSFAPTHTYGGSSTYTIVASTSDGYSRDEETVYLFVATPATTNSGVPLGVSGQGGGSGSGRSHNSDDSIVELSSDEDVVLTEDEMETCGTMTFTDVSEDSPYYDSVYALWCDGVIHGRSATIFAPEDNVHRDEASKIIARLFGFVTMAHSDIPEVTETSYSDVSTDEPLVYYIETLTDEGMYEEELSENEFRPHEDMTFEEVIDLIEDASGKTVTDIGVLDADITKRGGFVDFALSLFE